MAKSVQGSQGRSRQKCVVEAYTASIHSGLSSLYLYDGRPGKVIRVDVAVRTGKEISLTQIMRKSLINNMNVKGVQQIALVGCSRSLLAGSVRTLCRTITALALNILISYVTIDTVVIFLNHL